MRYSKIIDYNSFLLSSRCVTFKCLSILLLMKLFIKRNAIIANESWTFSLSLSHSLQLLSHFYTLAAIFVLVMPATITNVYDIIGRNELLNGLFISIARPIWGIAIAWIVYSCHTGLNKPLNAFFSWKFWIPIGRMGLSIYLIHPIIQVNSVILQNKRVSLEVDSMVRLCRINLMKTFPLEITSFLLAC